MLPDPVDHGHLLDTLAWLVQHPGRKVSSALLLIGAQGTGKSFLYQLLLLLLGSSNLRKVENNELDGEWRSSWGNKQVLFLEEVVHRGRREIANGLKEWITGGLVTVNEKYVRMHQVRTPQLIVATSNAAEPIYLEPSDRRWAVLKSPSTPREPEYYARLFNDGLRQAPAFLHWLLQRDLSRFDPHAPPPMTEAKAEMIRGCRSELSVAVEELIQEGGLQPVFTLEDVKMKLPWRLTDRIRNNKLPRLLKEFGCRNFPQQVRHDRGRLRLGFLPGVALPATGAAAVEMYLSASRGVITPA